MTCFWMTFIRYAQGRKIGKQNNFKSFGSKITKWANRIAKVRKGHLWLREENLSFNNNYLSLRNWLGRKAFICNTVTWANVCVDILNIFYSHMRNSCISSLQHVCSIRKQHRRYSNLPMWYGLLSGTGNFNSNLSEWWNMGRNSTSLLA